VAPQHTHTWCTPHLHTGGQVPAALLLQATRDLLSQLQAGGYLCGYQVVWGSLPGGWPGDWASSQPQLLGPDQQELQVPPSPGGQQQQQQQQQEQQQQSLEPGFTFQVTSPAAAGRWLHVPTPGFPRSWT
jgi:hypothetical protein